TSIRSCLAGGGYASWDGTSMAAPHVTGAVLLLKEAFPYLPGEELMLALYFSCTDLGAPGEDNNYGMGLINVPAAYQYLIDQ
ncbi:MAG: S8 family serine peptidase, partial [Phaeodactylibacter sp.]|nr:S8 family serine peptidase [Phaeodactylibacter sp.]